MATFHSPLGPVQGKLDESLHARIVNGKNILARNPRFSKKRWETQPNWARSRENAYNFAAQSITASAILRGLGHLKRHAGPYAHNAILSAISPLFRAGLFGGRQATCTDPDIMARHLLALDLSPAALDRAKSPISQGKLTRLPSPSDINPGETLAFRVHTIRVELQPLQWDEGSKSYHSVQTRCFASPEQPRCFASPNGLQPATSEWMTWENPADFPAITTQGIQNNRKSVMRGSNDLPSITFTVIEWRASRGNRHRNLRSCNSFFVSAVTLSQSAPEELLLHTPLQLQQMKLRRNQRPVQDSQPALSMAQTILNPAFQSLQAMSDCTETQHSPRRLRFSKPNSLTPRRLRSEIPYLGFSKPNQSTPKSFQSPSKSIQHPPRTRQNSVQSPLSGGSAGQSSQQGKHPAQQPTLATKRPSKTTQSKGVRTAY